MKRKEWAVQQGLATPGRGRLSREALDAIEKARAEGMTFDDDNGVSAPRKPREKSEKAASGSKSTKAKSDGGDGFFANETRYPIDSKWAGFDSKNKKHTISGRNVCFNCGYSLCGHTCNSPVALLPNLETAPVSLVG